MPSTTPPSFAPALQPLRHTRILSLALNLPGPAALLRCRQLGADCAKLEPPAPAGHQSGDPMGHYSPAAYAALHEGIRIVQANLKTPQGQAALQAELAAADVLLTSFRPSALARLGLDWGALQQRWPRLSLVRIVGAAGERAEEPGHDLTYQAEAGLLAHSGCALPASLHADMAGALAATEAVLQALLARGTSGCGACIDVALADAAHWLALPHAWGLTTPSGDVGGAHAGYAVHACADGRVALAALEPHFAERLFTAAGLPPQSDPRAPATHQAVAAFVAGRSCADLQALAREHDLPLHPLPAD
ncbi:CoA transferase [Paracidovorax wautersii]|uniref:Crotonobetainyl-CoA:carnitine CoA-transferase CaiB n=1 Tax=Paracidovorax wautersii TaxID=1177982 RepID=A0A1I2DKL7_9BURK|nr:CoA transferase [Paracidovorax wautersii]SFE81192.1 Crotonobetainyl-CoA:carnitine CoA-transferase CaiB [Paracidovorax wautersii]